MNLSMFDSQIMSKTVDAKKVKSTINMLASDTYFYNQGDSFIKILDKVSNSLEFMKACLNHNSYSASRASYNSGNEVGDKRSSKRSEGVSKNIFIMQSLIEELLDRKLLIEDYIDVAKIRELTSENKLYRGITINSKIFDIINEISNK